ncbi:ABC transporter substrate-binding protein [Zunongwangia sp. HRR-M8]|uniref:ABC transporter substrate-binding protein n=1 Tax=Zunongwangia sp. HRR-M8 TaxID=3015170 RepID=UPI0022DD08A5|nr:extracellular solute-binding protein [Zunongwangia sp. HRR-M8]WBL23367.1 extracellular solute-binding protein [Zunongwangia sp. HRR-M8]
MDDSPKILKGITWGHTRGLVPLQACAQRFRELYPNVHIEWRQRTLQEFADYPIEELTKIYDLLVIDHPWVGCAAKTHCVLPLEEHLPEEFIKNQQENQVGGSHDSYNFGGHQWALAIDAAAPVPSFRTDLLHKNDTEIPKTWEQVLDLARKGKVAAPAIPIDLLMNFYMFCQAHGEMPFQSEELFISENSAFLAMETMKEFYSLLDGKMFQANPIKVAEMMTSGNDFWYCPFAYGYANYTHRGYAKYQLHYGDLVSFKGKKLRSTLGGTGLSVSEFSEHKKEALKFAEMVASERYQSTEFVLHGGQPGHRKAWLDETNNAISNNCFQDSLKSLDNSYLRPRYNGYLHFQDHAGDPLQQFLKGEKRMLDAFSEMNSIYKESLKTKNEK